MKHSQSTSNRHNAHSSAPEARTRSCPDAERLAAFVDGAADESERSLIEEHLNVCARCYESLAEVVEYQREETAGRVRRIKATAGILALAASIAVAVAIHYRAFSPNVLSPELQQLVAAVGDARVIDGRTTGGFAHGTLTAPARGGTSPIDIATPEVRIAVARIERKVEEARTQQNLAELGVAYLAVADGERAVLALEEAVDAPSPSPRALSDLGAAYLQRFTQNNEPQDIVRAVVAAQRAVVADPRLPEAHFNLAVGLERLFLTTQASKAWQQYLKTDGSSEWAGEARERYQRLNQRAQAQPDDTERRLVEEAARDRTGTKLQSVVAQFPSASSAWAENQLLVVWADSYLKGHRAEALDALDRSRRIAKMLSAATGDRFLEDAIGAVDAASSFPDRTATLARAHRTFEDAMAKYENDAYAESTELFAGVLPTLQTVGSPYALWARLQLAIALYRKPDLNAAGRQLEPLIQSAKAHGYVRLTGLLLRMRGLISGVKGTYPEQATDYRTAAQKFQRVGDLENMAAIHASLAESMDLQGDSRRGWSHRLQALAGLERVTTYRRRQPILIGSAIASLRQGFPHTALFFQEAALATAREWNRPAAVAEGHLKKAEIEHRLGLDDLSRVDLVEAQRTLTALGNNSFASTLRAGIQLASGEIQQRENPDAAIASVTTALDFYERTGVKWASARAHLARGRAQLAAGRAELAERDFALGIRGFEEQRGRVTDESIRLAYFEQPWDLYTEMIRLKTDQREPNTGLKFAEQARSRTLLEAVSPSRHMPPVDPERSLSRIPPNAAIIFYVVLDERVLGWVLTNDGTSFFRREIRETELARLVGDCRSPAVTPARRIGAMKRLYDELIRPAHESIKQRSALVLVPDGVLHTLPFASLTESATGRYLVEDFAVATAPSLTIFLELSAAPNAALTSALGVGNPTLAETGLRLPDLPDSEHEARETVSAYPRGQLLTGSAATKTRFLELINRYDVVHFAGHAVSNSLYPSLSQLLLAADNGKAGNLFAHELAGRTLSDVDVVVLAACQTSMGQIRRGEGVLSLARPFLAARVPVVIATLWDLNDTESRPLFRTFHAALQKGRAPFDALREAQLSMLNTNRDTSQPPTWAGVIAIGGIAGLHTYESELATTAHSAGNQVKH